MASGGTAGEFTKKGVRNQWGKKKGGRTLSSFERKSETKKNARWGRRKEESNIVSTWEKEGRLCKKSNY